MTQLRRVQIEGYRPFRRFGINVDSLQVFVGPNGSGKSSLFEFLQILRDGMESDIPPTVAPGPAGKTIFHAGTSESVLRWLLRFEHPDGSRSECLEYGAEILGPVGQIQISEEFVAEAHKLRSDKNFKEVAKLLELTRGEGELRSPHPVGPDGNQVDWRVQQLELKSHRRLALGTVHDRHNFPELNALGECIAKWVFVDGLGFDLHAMRQPATVEQGARLRDDGANLSAVLFQLQSEHPNVFAQINRRMGSFVDSFGDLTVKAQGAPGQVLAFTKEDRFDRDLSLTDLSDGILRLLALTVLCYQPQPPPLVCIDEPVQGVHPKTIPILAGMFQKLATKTQVFLVTHSPYFLSQFSVEDIIVFTCRDGQTVARRPADSEVLIAILEDFGTQELRQLLRTDELTMLSPPVAVDDDYPAEDEEEGP